MSNHSGFTLRPGLSVRFVSVVFGTALALLMSLSALAEESDSQVKTAAVHATLAVDSADIQAVQMHLHHTLNCLVGPEGDGFDADEMNPCDGMGNGAITDAKDEDNKDELEKVASVVKDGLDSDDYDEAKDAATSAQDMLNEL